MAILGAGAMGELLAGGMLRAGWARRELVLAARRPERQKEIELRAGVHTGEAELVGDDVAGMAVHIAARVAACAGAGEVLTSSTVRELVVGSPVVFEDRGEHELKGVPGRWRLHAVGG